MDKSYLIKLTLSLYRVTEIFPNKEPLKHLLREKANQILADCFLLISGNSFSLSEEEKERCYQEISKNINLVQVYFKIGENQNWLKQENFLVLKKEYGKIEEEIRQNFNREKRLQEKIGAEENIKTEKPFSSSSSGTEFPKKIKNQRQSLILNFLKNKNELQVKDLKTIFPKISKRTLRRDFDELFRNGIVKRIGDNSRTSYKLDRTKIEQDGTIGQR